MPDGVESVSVPYEVDPPIADAIGKFEGTIGKFDGTGAAVLGVDRPQLGRFGAHGVDRAIGAGGQRVQMQSGVVEQHLVAPSVGLRVVPDEAVGALDPEHGQPVADRNGEPVPAVDGRRPVECVG